MLNGNRNWAGSRSRLAGQKPVYSRDSGSSNRSTYLQLEQRNLFAFIGYLDVPNEILYLTQSANDGAVVIDNNGAGNAIQVTDGAGLVDFGTAQNVHVKLLGTPNDVFIDLDHALTGNLRASGIGGDLWLTGDSNTVMGSAAFFGNSSEQTFHLSENVLFHASGDLMLGGGDGYDALKFNSNGMVIGGNLRFDRINEVIDSGEIRLQGNFSAEVYDEAQAVVLDHNGLFQIGGNFTFNYFENSSRTQNDSMVLGKDVQVSGRTFIDLGRGSGTGVQLASFQDSALSGTITVRGSQEVEHILLDTSVAPGLINLELGTGADVVTVGDATPGRLVVDFGGDVGDVEFTSTPSFDVRLLNWAGVNRFYEPVSRELRIVQAADVVEELTIQNRATDGTLGLSIDEGAAATMMFPVDKLGVQMLDNSTTSLSFTLERAMAGSTSVWLGDGDRTLEFNGSVNAVAGSMRIDGGVGDQTIVVASGAPLDIGVDLFVALRIGSDSIHFDGSTTSVGRRMTLRDPNLVVNHSDFFVADDFVIWMQGSMQSNEFQNYSAFHVGRDVVYGGWTGRDVIGFYGEELIDRFLRVAMADEFEDTNGMTVAGIVDFSGGGHGNSGVFRMGENAVIGVGVSIWFDSTSTYTETVLRGRIDGGHVIFYGSSNSDVVVVDLDAPFAGGYITAYGGQDTVTLGANTVLDNLFIDFGADLDTFVDEIGPPYPFPVDLQNLP